MAFFGWFSGARAATQSKAPGKGVSTPEDLERALRQMSMRSTSGEVVNTSTAMRVAAVYACVRLISGAVANLPFSAYLRVSEGSREHLGDHAVSQVISRKPNGWQTPSQFKRMLTAHLLLRGNAYAQIVWSRGRVIGLNPLDPDRMEVTQNVDLSLRYVYTRKGGSKVLLASADVFHLVGLSLDGIVGVSPITYARETIGLSIAQEKHGAITFKNSARPSSVLTHPGKLGKEGMENLRASVDQHRAGGEREGSSLILEEGMGIEQIAMTAEDAQWIESRKFSRADIAMFFGVPPHMIGDTEKSTSWGSGIEQQSIGFVTYTLEDHLTAWEETANRDLIGDGEPNVYARFNRKALVRGDIKTRTDHYVRMLQWGAYSTNEVRQLEDMNPRDGGDVFYDPPNTAGGEDHPENKGDGNDASRSS